MPTLTMGVRMGQDRRSLSPLERGVRGGCPGLRGGGVIGSRGGGNDLYGHCERKLEGIMVTFWCLVVLNHIHD